jgi:uncharacterized protein (DUF2235 family)
MPKRIVIFADGTGNAFSTQESNVWRLYEAVDKSEPDQIAYYIKGVGTSSIKMLSALDGATGFGVPSNVRELYRFLCRNWEPGDQIFMFGFSRGAFTIRTLIGVINSQGLVPNELYGETVTHDEMTRNVNNAWRSYREHTAPWHSTLPTIWIARWVRDAVLTLKDIAYYRRRYLKFRYKAVALHSRRDVAVTFAGLFDTVEAYGVPIEELRKAIDVAIWPISFNNRRLSPIVQCARHALALDDERITFHPLRFDRSQETKEDRIKEVWFAGVHSDVGGGYPDDELALVPCVWMADEAKAHGLRFKQGAIEGLDADSSALAKRHDSRAGASVFYRYAPRPLETSAEAGGIPVIHHSVAERMVEGSDNYAPLTLPHTAKVLLPNGDTPQIHGFDRKTVSFAPARADGPVAEAMTVALAAVEQLKEPDPVMVEHTLGTVSLRRATYFLMLGLFAVVVAWPWIVDQVDAWREGFMRMLPLGGSLIGYWDTADYAIAAVLDAMRTAVGSLIPAYLKAYVDALADSPVLTGSLILAVIGFWRLHGTLGDRINDRARMAWGLSTHAPEREIRNGVWSKIGSISRTRPVRWVHQALVTYVVPTAVILLLGAVVAVGIGRAVFTAEVGMGFICRAPGDKKSVPASTTPGQAGTFNAADMCWWTGLKVEKGRKYLIGIEMQAPWFDRTIFASPHGFDGAIPALAVPLRRWTGAKWFQPVVKIGSEDTFEQVLEPIDGALPDTEAGPADIDDSALGWFEPMSKLRPEQVAAAQAQWNARKPQRVRFVAEFTADNSGDLFLYVNDAINIFWLGGGYGLFYQNNTGTADVWLQMKPLPERPPEKSSGQPTR